MRNQRNLATTIGLGAVVVLLGVAAGYVIWDYGQEGITAITDGRAQEAIIAAAVCLGAVVVPVLALALYQHWISVTTRPARPRRERIPSLAEEIGLGLLTLGAVFGCAFGAQLAYEEAVALLEDERFGYGLAYASGGIALAAFALFCVIRYFQWLKD